MIVSPLDGVDGARLIEIERHEDERGFFARTMCEHELAAAGLPARWVQSSVSFNRRSGTLRGMHWQAAPDGEAKLVRVTSGRVWDVILDLRDGSATRGGHAAVELSATSRATLYVPPGVAHGFLTLEGDTEVLYMMSTSYDPAAGRGLRWDDPSFGLPWPRPPAIISARDAGYPDHPWEAR